MLDEKSLILKSLSESGSISGVSRILNISRSTVRDKMKKYGIEFNQTDLEGIVL
jgi:transcriptional regulator of acetoin/glycerol metabolism